MKTITYSDSIIKFEQQSHTRNDIYLQQSPHIVTNWIQIW